VSRVGLDSFGQAEVKYAVTLESGGRERERGGGYRGQDE